MLKKCLLAVLAAGLISATATFAAAQDNQSPNNQPNDQQAPPSQDAGRHHGMPDPAERTQHLAKHLKLTSDQQTKVQQIFESERSQMESLHQDTSLSQQDRRAKMMDIRKNTDSQVREVLDSNQQKKWDEMQSKREQRMGNRQGSPESGSGQPAPPQ